MGESLVVQTGNEGEKGEDCTGRFVGFGGVEEEAAFEEEEFYEAEDVFDS